MTLLELVDVLDSISRPDQGLQFHGGDGGKRRYDPETGEPYYTTPTPTTLTLYGDRARKVMELISKSKDLSDRLRAKLYAENIEG